MDFDCVTAFIVCIVGLILGIIIGKCINNTYDNCFIKDDYVYCEKKGQPTKITKIRILEGENNE